jgi:hypothetical protein
MQKTSGKKKAVSKKSKKAVKDLSPKDKEQKVKGGSGPDLNSVRNIRG